MVFFKLSGILQNCQVVMTRTSWCGISTCIYHTTVFSPLGIVSSTSAVPPVPLPSPGPVMVQPPIPGFAPCGPSMVQPPIPGFAPCGPSMVPPQGQSEHSVVQPEMWGPPMMGSTPVIDAPVPPLASDMVPPQMDELPPFPDQLEFNNPGYFSSLLMDEDVLMDGDENVNNPLDGDENNPQLFFDQDDLDRWNLSDPK